VVDRSTTLLAPDGFVPPEVERLLNPAYCGAILAQFAGAYTEAQGNAPDSGVPFPLVFLCLPLVLHARTYVEINKHGKPYGLHRVVRERPQILGGLPERVTGFRRLTREALLFGCTHGQLYIAAPGGAVRAQKSFLERLTARAVEGDGWLPIRAAERLGAWYGQITESEVFLHLGLRP
jgi:hypothetical protein